MAIRAKFVVSTLILGEGFAQLKMRPVNGKSVDGKYVPDSENSKFWEASPSGDFSLTVQDKAPAFPLVRVMQPGTEFYLDLTLATGA